MRYGTDPEKEDVGNLMRALTMKRLLLERVRASEVEGFRG